MKSKFLLTGLVGFAVMVIVAGTFAAGFVVGHNISPVTRQLNTAILPSPEPTPVAITPTLTVIAEETAVQAGTPPELEGLFTPFWESWAIIHERFVDQPLDDQDLARGAIQGMLDTLDDPQTAYLDPDTLRQSNMTLGGGYQGIGAWVDTNREYLTVVSPMPGSPAERAGLKPGDEIIAIDGEDMTGIDGNLVIRRVLGPAGTTVRLTVRRAGRPDPFEVEIVRDLITIPSVVSRMEAGNIAYIQLQRFVDPSAADLKVALEELLAQNPAGLILDLRFNGGGLLNSAVEITSEFIPEGVVLYEEYGDGSRDTHRIIPGGIATEIPLVVLINEGSASGSEILAGAVQDSGRGILVGTKSFGKGSVQVVQPLSNNQGAIRVTIARWLTPNGRQIEGTGLDPDVVVERTDEDIQADRDPQLEKALELLIESAK